MAFLKLGELKDCDHPPPTADPYERAMYDSVSGNFCDYEADFYQNECSDDRFTRRYLMERCGFPRETKKAKCGEMKDTFVRISSTNIPEYLCSGMFGQKI